MKLIALITLFDVDVLRGVHIVVHLYNLLLSLFGNLSSCANCSLQSVSVTNFLVSD